VSRRRSIIGHGRSHRIECPAASNRRPSLHAGSGYCARVCFAVYGYIVRDHPQPSAGVPRHDTRRQWAFDRHHRRRSGGHDFCLAHLLRCDQRLAGEAQALGAHRVRPRRVTKPLFPLATGVGTVFVARFVDRIGKGIRGAPRDALIADVTPLALRGTAFGLRQSMDTVGAFLGPLLAMLIMFRARPEITESTFDRVRYGFTTCLGYHML